MTSEDEEDRISILPDDLIHQILKSVETKLAVQTSVLSKRWRLVWTTLPFLNFTRDFPKKIIILTHHVLNHRDNDRSQVLTLCLKNWYLQPFYFSLPALTTLILYQCHLPKHVWDFPSLKTLVLYDVGFLFPQHMSDIFAALVSLENLTLCFYMNSRRDYSLHCPQLKNLEIKTRYFNGIYNRKIVVLAPKLSNFTSVGIVSVTFEDSQLDNVCIKLRGWIDHKNFPQEELKRHYQHFRCMLSGFGSTKILNLELETIEALSSISDFLARSPSPFYDLKYVKLPHGCKEGKISRTLRSYLLGGSPTATIVTTLPQDTMIPHTATTSVTAQNVVIEEYLAAPTKVLVDSENMNKIVCVDTVDMGVQEENVMQN